MKYKIFALSVLFILSFSTIAFAFSFQDFFGWFFSLFGLNTDVSGGLSQNEKGFVNSQSMISNETELGNIRQSGEAQEFYNNQQNVTTDYEEEINCDVIVIGGGSGGTAAAIQSARLGAKTCLIEETSWLGGMVSSAGVTAFDGNPSDTKKKAMTVGFFKEFVDRLKNYYNGSLSDCYSIVGCFEPHVANEILKDMASEEKNLKIFYNTYTTEVIKDNNTVKGVLAKNKKNGQKIKFNGFITVDATEYGDVIA
ncbi:MAG: hypothetical protein B6U68_02530, partial [Candidatus Aenigmarchaeota archaeon ex4484_14]